MEKHPKSFLESTMELGSNMLTATGIAAAGGVMLGSPAASAAVGESRAGGIAAVLLIFAIIWVILAVARLHEQSQLGRLSSLALIGALLFTGTLTTSLVFAISSASSLT